MLHRFLFLIFISMSSSALLAQETNIVADNRLRQPTLPEAQMSPQHDIWGMTNNFMPQGSYFAPLAHPYNEGLYFGVRGDIFRDSIDYAMSMVVANTNAYGDNMRHLSAFSWQLSRNLSLSVTSVYSSYTGLMDVQSANGNLRYQLGRMSLSGGLSANRFNYNGRVFTQYGMSGQFSYYINPHLSMTLFADYYNNNPFVSMAAFPYIPTTRYGGYVTYHSDRFYLDLGAERRYNTFSGKMETVPIVTPGFKISKKIIVELPLGDFAKQAITDIVTKKRNH